MFGRATITLGIGPHSSYFFAMLFGHKKVPVCMSKTSSETACLKFIYTKFACSMKKGAGTPYQRVPSQKALPSLIIVITTSFISLALFSG